MTIANSGKSVEEDLLDEYMLPMDKSAKYYYDVDEESGDWVLLTQVAQLTIKEFDDLTDPNERCFPPPYKPVPDIQACVPFRVRGQTYVWKTEPRWVLTKVGE